MSLLASIVLVCLACVGIIWLLDRPRARPGLGGRPYDWERDGI